MEDSNLIIYNSIFEGKETLFEYIEGSVIYASNVINISIFEIKNCKFINFLQDSNVIFVLSNNVTSIIFENLNFFNINSRTGNGIFTLSRCAGVLNNIEISYSKTEGNLINIKDSIYHSDQLENYNQIIISNLSLKHNQMNSDGIYINILNIDYINVYNCFFL